LQGHLEAPFLELTPGTRPGIIQDSPKMAFCEALAALEHKLVEIIEAQRRAEEEKASREQLRTIQRAFREALLALPAEEYDWFDISARRLQSASQRGTGSDLEMAPGRFNDVLPEAGAPEPESDRQRQFFEFPDPLFTVTISPASSIVRVGSSKELRALPRDRSRRPVDADLEFHWEIVEGLGALSNTYSQSVTFLPDEPGLSRVKVTVRQRDTTCSNEALLTVTNELLTEINPTTIPARGLPGYTFERASGESWRSKFDSTRNLIVVNNGHRDFVYASRTKSLKLRYLVWLYAKELVLHNFAGLPADHLLERMVELSLRTEEHL
jgi:hypothetical protein